MPHSRINEIASFNGTDYIIRDQILYPQPSCPPKVICVDLLQDVASGAFEVRFGYYWYDKWIQDTLMAPTSDVSAILSQMQQKGWLGLQASTMSTAS